MQAVIEYFSIHGSDYVTYVIEHIEVSVLAVLLAMIVGIPLGIISARFHWFAMLSTGIWGTFRIIPSLAILVLLIPFMGTGVKPAVIALTILAIPPILINTILGFQTVPANVIEAAEGMGMSPGRLFWSIKVPLAFPVVFTGIQTATVEVIASATLASYIGAGGLGTIIFTGLGLMRQDLLWIGGLSVACLSLGTGFLLSRVENYIRRYERVNEGK